MVQHVLAGILYITMILPRTSTKRPTGQVRGGGKQTNITYTYSVATIIGLCEGQIAGINRIWKDKEVYNYPAEEVGLSLFDGASTQSPWSYVAQHHPDKSLPYNGLAYMAGVIDLGDSAAMPTYNFEVKGKLLSTGDGVDVNPADYIRALLDRVGLSDVNIENLDEYRKYCKRGRSADFYTGRCRRKCCARHR